MTALLENINNFYIQYLALEIVLDASFTGILLLLIVKFITDAFTISLLYLQVFDT